MAQSNKILTVSYGTFSCTLEGFDNPFGTMQSIAEYFRDLAAEDRYFGAEPPQPDAQMLHQIAEREVRRRVEARVADNGVVLRQMTDPGQPAPTADTTQDDAPESQAPGSETVVERLARIRSVVAKARAERDRTYEEDEQVDDDQDESLLTAFAEAEDAEVSEEDDFAAEAPVDDDSEPTFTAADALEQEAADAPVEEGQIASAPEDLTEPEEPAELSQISGVQQVGDPGDVAILATGLATDPASRAEVGAALTEQVSGDPLPSTKADAALEVAAADLEETTAETEALSAAPEPEDTPTDAAEVDPDLEANLARLRAAISAADEPAGETQTAPETAAASSADDDWVEVEVEEDDGTPRIIRMSRAEFEDALAKGDLEEIEEDQAENAEIATADEDRDAIREILASTDLDDKEAHSLAAELAELEREGEEDAPKAIEPPAEPAKGKEGDDRNIARLIDETNAHMGEPDAHRRRNAIQHLRAAVAATKADERLRDRAPEQDASIAKFRDDLQKAVRPRRPEPAGPSRRPQPLTGAGPLVLVSSQRVDTQAGIVRPARPEAARSPEAARPERETFLEFAAKLGARELPDLLEAAAAYSKIVEGQEGAPRPVLIRRATSAAPAGTASREEGLKSFGQLLRAGRIRKIDAGRFALAEDAEIARKARIAN